MRRFGAPVSSEQLADPLGQPGHAVVRIGAATVGHLDRTIWSGSFARHPPLPYTPGVEGSGVVVSSDRFAPGDRVWLRGGGLGTTRDGTWAELAVAPDEALGLLPDGVGHDVGSAFFSPCASAWLALHTIAEVRPGQRVAVTGATGAVGSIAVQLALDAGADVVGVVSRPDRLDHLDPGVAGVVVAPDAAADIIEQVAPVDVLIDTVGGSILEATLSTVQPGGTVVLVGYVAGPTITISLPTLIQRDVSLRPLNMIRREHEGRAVAGELLQRIADGRLTVAVTSFPLDEAGAALAWLDDPHHRGRAVLVPADGPT